MRCEDFPCCGHESGDCPDRNGQFTCVECGGRLSKNNPDSFHARCKMKFLAQEDELDRYEVD